MEFSENNSTSSETLRYYENLEYWVEGVLLFIVGFIGLMGNSAAIFVFARQHVQKNFHYLMLALASFDLGYILVSFILFALPQFIKDFRRGFTYNWLLPYVLPLCQMAMTGSIYCTIAITIERYFTVCHPFFRISHSMPAKMYIIPILTFSFLYNLPKFFELTTIIEDVSKMCQPRNETLDIDCEETYGQLFDNLSFFDAEANTTYYCYNATLSKEYCGTPNDTVKVATLTTIGTNDSNTGEPISAFKFPERNAESGFHVKCVLNLILILNSQGWYDLI